MATGRLLLVQKKLEEIINTTRPVSVDIQLALYEIFIPIIAVLIILLNSVIVVTSGLILHKDSLSAQQPRSTYILLGNVALSDLLLGVTILFGQYYPGRLRNEMICCIIIGLTVSSTISSVYSVGLIAIDRYLYILYGLQYQRYLSSKRARIMVLFTWIIGLLVGFVPAMGYRNPTNNGQLCWFVILAPPELVFATTTIGIIPLVVIIILYSIILKHALSKISELKEAARNQRGFQTGSLRLFRGGLQSRSSSMSVLDNLDQSRSKPPAKDENKSAFLRIFRRSRKKKPSVQIAPVYNPSKWKAIKIVLYTTGSFFITWFPYFFASSLFAVCNPKKTPVYCDNLRIAIASPLLILGLCNSLLNPLIYAWWHNGFRESIKKICRSITRKKKEQEPTSESSRTRSSVIRRRSGEGVTSGSEYELSDLEQRTIISQNNAAITRQNNEINGGIANAGSDVYLN